MGFYKMILKAITSVLPRKTKDRFIRLGDKTELQQYLESSKLPDSYGGYRPVNDFLWYLNSPGPMYRKTSPPSETLPPTIPPRPSNIPPPTLPQRPPMRPPQPPIGPVPPTPNN